MEDFNPFGLFTGVWIPDFLLSYPGVSPAAKICYARLGRYCGRKTNICFPSVDELAEELGVTTRSVSSYLKELENDGFIEIIRRGLQLTNQYRLTENQVIKDFLRDTLSDQDRKNPSDPDQKNPSDPSIELKRVNIRESVSSGSETISTIEERLDSDVNYVHLSDLDSVELPDEPAKSKRQTWTSGDRSSFWGQWGRKAKKPDAGIRSRVNRWLEFKDPKQAVTAVNGYADSKPDSMTIEEFQRGYWEYYKLGEAAERPTAPVPTPSVSPTTISTPAIEPSASWGPLRAIARWNEIVVSRPVTWDWDHDDDRDLKKACADPVFEQRFDELCEKAEKANRDGLDRPFQWMLERFGGKTGQWWKFLDRKPMAKFKVQESLSDTMAKLVEKNFGKG